MKIGILTFHRALNYGAVWQCWALIYACQKLGHEVHVIDYAPTGIWQYQYFKRQRLDKRIANTLMHRRFYRFYQSLPRTCYYGESHSEIVNNPPQLDAYIVGSDQMWAEKIVGGNIGSFVFDFAPENVRRISYAVSQGGLMSENPVFHAELRKFYAISLREPTWKQKLSAISGKDVEDVCDPSLLVPAEEYAKKEKKVWFLPKHYIAVFDLNNEPQIRQMAKQLKSKLGVPIVSVAGSYKHWCDRSLLGISPEQWIYVMRHADFICTNGFHGTAFSIVFRKPFISVAANGKDTAVKDDRKINILTQCGMMSQYVKSVDDLSAALPCDYSKAESMIDAYRTRSLNWLKNVLNNG